MPTLTWRFLSGKNYVQYGNGHPSLRGGRLTAAGVSRSGSRWREVLANHLLQSQLDVPQFFRGGDFRGAVTAIQHAVPWVDELVVARQDEAPNRALGRSVDDAWDFPPPHAARPTELPQLPWEAAR